MEALAKVEVTRTRVARLASHGAFALWFVAAHGLLFVFETKNHLDNVVGPSMVALFVLGVIAMVASWAASLVAVRLRGTVRVAARDGVLDIAERGKSRSVAVASAHTQLAPSGGGRAEVTARAGDTWVVDVPTPEAAEALVAGLGFAPGKRPTTYRLAARAQRALHVPLAFAAYLLGSQVGGLAFGALALRTDAMFAAFPYLVVMTMLGSYLAIRRFAEPPVVTVGADGIVVRTFGRTRYVPLADVVAATQVSLGAPVGLRLRSGKGVLIGGTVVDLRRRDALARHIRVLLAARDARAPAPVALARAGRPVREWREEVRRAAEGTGYRVASPSLPHDALAAIVAAPGAQLEERLGAAMALRVVAPDAGDRIRVAASACVDPLARAALEAAADDDVEALARAVK